MLKSAIVILNWNGRGFLEKYLPGIVSSVSDNPRVEVVVADNCSTDSSLSFLRDSFPSVRVISLKRNYGFALGYNKALERIDADVFILLNSDVEVDNGWFEPLEEWMEYHPDCGICGPKLLGMEHRDCFEYAGAAGGLIDKYGYPLCRGRIMDRVEEDEGQYDDPCEVFWISGAALAVRSSVFHAMGGFRADFFMHMEEIDLCWRARLAGCKVHIVPRSRVYHLGGGTLRSGSSAKVFYNHRNNLLMLHSNMPATYGLLGGFTLLEKLSDQQAGPDFFGNCFDAFLDMSVKERKDFCTLCAHDGVAVMRLKLFVRWFLDVATALMYLFTLRPSCAGAVFRARRDFRRMRRSADTKRLARFLRDVFEGKRRDIVDAMLSEGPELKCVSDRWVVALRFSKNKTIV